MSKRKRSHEIVQRILKREYISLVELGEVLDQVTVGTHPKLSLKSGAQDGGSLERYLSTGTGCSIRYRIDRCSSFTESICAAINKFPDSVTGLTIVDCEFECICELECPLYMSMVPPVKQLPHTTGYTGISDGM